MSANGNGHSPPFRLAPIESPEEEARGLVLKEIAPQIRRRVREDSRLSPGAKYFFNCLFDDCFWHQAGGHGTGQIYADVRDLGERYQAWPDTITRWRDVLAEAGWLWTKYAWPMTVGVSVGVPVVFFLMFEIWFKVPLPKGPLEAALGLN